MVRCAVAQTTGPRTTHSSPAKKRGRKHTASARPVSSPALPRGRWLSAQPTDGGARAGLIDAARTDGLVRHIRHRLRMEDETALTNP